MIALATPPDILDQASAYARVMLLTMPLGFVFLLMTAMLRGVGDTLTPLMALALSTAIGLFLTPLLIRGWFGTYRHRRDGPGMGVGYFHRADAGRARPIYLRHKKSPLAPDAEEFACFGSMARCYGKILGIGIPSAVGMVVMAVAELVLLGVVNGFGSEATAAYGAVNQIMGYAQFTAISISISVSILGAQAIGAGHADRLDAIVRDRPVTQSRPDRWPGGADLSVSARGAGRLHYRHQLAKGLLIIALWSSVPFGMATVFSGAMRGGVALAPMLLSIFAIAAIEIPSAVILSRTIGLEGVWAAYPIVFCAMFVLQLGYYTLVWRRRPLRRMV